MALTFDAGSGTQGVSSILETLRRADVPATFFLTGSFARAHPSTARTIAAAHPVGNHTEHHRDLTTLSRGGAVDEVRSGRRSIANATGEETRPLFRFPFGARDERTIGLVNDECYVAYRWTVDTLGWKGTSGGISASTVHDRVLRGLRPGEIVLMHVGANPDDGTTLDAAALPRVIASIRAQGYGFTTLPR